MSQEIKAPLSNLLSARGVQKRMRDAEPRKIARPTPEVLPGDWSQNLTQEEWDAEFNTPLDSKPNSSTRPSESRERFAIEKVKLLGMPSAFTQRGLHTCGGPLMVLNGGIGHYVECSKCGYWKAD